MRRLTIDQMLERFAKDDQLALLKALKRVDIDGVVVAGKGEDTTALVYGPGSKYKTLEAAWSGDFMLPAIKRPVPVGYYQKGLAATRTASAIEWMRMNPEASIRRAAELYQVSPSAISRSLRKPRCECCGQILRSLPSASA